MLSAGKCEQERNAMRKPSPLVNNLASLVKDELPDLKRTSGRHGKDLKNTIYSA